jgi:aminotransferase EvaB
VTSLKPEVLMTADPKADYLRHAEEIRAAVDRVLASGRYILGPEVEAFEREFAAYQGGGKTIAVANGSDALEIALRAFGVGSGDDVATVANTATATVAAIQQTGAKPLFVEIDPATMLMDPNALEELLTRQAGKVKAVIPVHLYGNAADMPAIVEVAARHNAAVIEDCAQAHGAVVAARKVGTWGEVAAFSFYPTKNLGALGDAGAIFTRDPGLAERARLLRQYGWRTRHVAEIPGRNSRLDEIQAAILRIKLRYLDGENAARAALARRYVAQLQALDPAKLALPVTAANASPVWHQFAVRTSRRDQLRAYLQTKDILCAVLYPMPVHRQPAYADPTVNLPDTERACAELLCLPCHPGLTTNDVDRVCREIAAWTVRT